MGMNMNTGSDPADTYVLDEDVMEEMENLAATVVLPESHHELEDWNAYEGDFLDNIEEATVVLNNRFSWDNE